MEVYFESNKFEEDDDDTGCSFSPSSTVDNTKLQFPLWTTGKQESKLLSSAIIETRKKTIFTSSNSEKLDTTSRFKMLNICRCKADSLRCRPNYKYN